jgi:NAD(P)H-hydrate epimerase
MAHGIRSRGDLDPLLARATTIVIGPGLGQEAWGQQLLQGVYEHVANSGANLVVDADALNILAERRVIAQPHYAQWVLTPHPGEAARMLACQNSDIQRDRFTAARELQQRFGGAIVLKGAGSLVATASGIAVSNYGNPGMASGGMGDVLSGVLGGLLAQGLSIDDAARLATCLHGKAGDLAAVAGERGLLATDLLPQLRLLVNP